VTGAIATKDGWWRFEAVRSANKQFYWLIHDDSVIDGLTIATVTRLLAEAGVDLADLADVTDRPAQGRTSPQPDTQTAADHSE